MDIKQYNTLMKELEEGYDNLTKQDYTFQEYVSNYTLHFLDNYDMEDDYDEDEDQEE